MKERFTRQLFYTTTVFYLTGTIIIYHQYFTQYPEMWDDTLYTNLWLFFYLFGTIFLVFTLITFDYENKMKKKKK